MIFVGIHSDAREFMGIYEELLGFERCSWICRDLWELVRIHGILEDSMGFVGIHMDL